MILKKLSLKNIRSYEGQEINFREGSTLLSGDIGAGKTSILLAIEFALFGLQPGQKGSSLLRNGHDKGSVSIELDIGGHTIFIERTIKRGKTFSQDYAAIEIDGQKQELSVTELKSKVLELMNYPKEFSRKQNLLYRFTVYTPQEEMKQIILQDPETRINTLRHIFGIDKYKKIIENASIVISKLREEKKIREGMILSLEQDKLDIISKENEMKLKMDSLSLAEGEFIVKKDKRKKVQEELLEISKQKDKKLHFEQEIEKTKIMISLKNSSKADNEKEINNLNLQISEMDKIAFDSGKIPELEKDINLMKMKKKDFDSKILEISAKISSFHLKNQENERIKERLKIIELCPTCLQDVNPLHKANVLKKIELNNFENSRQIEELSLQKSKIQNETKDLENSIFESERKIHELKILKIKLQSIEDKKRRVNEIKKLNSLIDKDLSILSGQIDLLKSNILKLRKFDILLEEKQKELDEALKIEKFSEIKIAELKKEIYLFSKYIDELKEKARQSEMAKSQLLHLSDLENWFSDNFIPLISFVEKNVMNKLKHEFSRLFSSWFLMLVSDNFNVKLNDDFTPIIEFQDYEIDYSYLSGGERTAIALAYRLALNQVINSILSDIKTKGLIILDEPTDGFSTQQLDRMRNVLEQLNVKQLIIVSHEQKMEEFVDYVIRFGKKEGKSFAEE